MTAPNSPAALPARKVVSTESDDEFLTPAQVSAEFGIKPSTLATWRCRGGGPRFHRPRPRVVKYRRSAIIEWLGAEVRHTGELAPDVSAQ